jgi:hypothetical protein
VGRTRGTSNPHSAPVAAGRGRRPSGANIGDEADQRERATEGEALIATFIMRMVLSTARVVVAAVEEMTGSWNDGNGSGSNSTAVELVQQIEINDFKDSLGHDAHLLRPFIEARRFLAAHATPPP